MLYGCLSPVRGGVCSLVVRVEASRSVSELFLICSASRRDFNTPTGRGATEYSSARAVHLCVCVCVCATFYLLCRLTNNTVFDTTIG